MLLTFPGLSEWLSKGNSPVGFAVQNILNVPGARSCLLAQFWEANETPRGKKKNKKITAGFASPPRLQRFGFRLQGKVGVYFGGREGSALLPFPEGWAPGAP